MGLAFKAKCSGAHVATTPSLVPGAGIRAATNTHTNTLYDRRFVIRGHWRRCLKCTGRERACASEARADPGSARVGSLSAGLTGREGVHEGGGEVGWRGKGGKGGRGREKEKEKKNVKRIRNIVRPQAAPPPQNPPKPRRRETR